MKPWTIALITIAVLAGTNYITYWQTGTMKEKQFAQRLHDSPATIDTTTRVTVTPQAPRHHQGTATARQTATEKADSDTAFNRALTISLDNLRERNAYISAKVDTTLGNDSTGSVRVQYDPPTRMLICDFQPPPIRQVDREILKTVYVPVIEHDSFWTRCALVGGGAIATGVIYAITK